MGLGVAGIAAIVSAVASVVSLAMTLSMKPKSPEANDSGAGIDRKGQDNPKVVPFGRCVVPAVRVWNNVNNMDTRYLAQAYSFGVGEIKEFERLYIDGVSVFGQSGPTANHWYGMRSSSEFPNLQVGVRTGRNTEEAYSQVFGHSDGEWTAAHRGDRTASATFLIERWINKNGDNDVRFISDRVKVEALVHGNKVIDPRFSTFERNWINEGRASYRNPACVLFTYLVDTYYGLGLPVDAINVNDFIELANYCDGKNFTFDGYIDQSDDFGAIIMDMCTAFDGIAYVEDGMIRVKADKLTYPVCHITEDDMSGNFRLSNTNDSAYCNIVNVEFVNENANHTVDKFVLPKDILTNPTIIADGYEKTKDIKLPFTSDNGDFNKVRRIANKHYRKARCQQTIDFEVDNTVKVFKVYDVVEITNKDYGLNKAQFRVVKIETTLDDKTTISKVVAEQYEPSVYDESNLDDGITSPPIKPPTNIIPSPVGLKFELTGMSLSGQGKLSWTTRYNRENRTVVEYKLASSSEWKRAGESQIDEYTFNGLRPDNYDFRVMTKTFLGSTSNWAELKGVKIQGGLTLPKVTNLKANFSNETCILSWDDMKSQSLNIQATEHYDGIKTIGDVFSHYEIIVYKGSTPKYVETLSSASEVFAYSYDMNVKSGVSRNLKFEVRIVAVDGSEGGLANVTAKNAQCTQPSGVIVNGRLVQLNVRWDQSSDKDYAATDIHISSNSTFTPSASTLVETVTTGSVVISREYNGVNYMRVGHYDKFGKDGMSYSAAIAFEMQDIDDLLDNSNKFDDVLGDITNIDTEVDKAKADITKAKADIIKNASEINKTNSVVSTQGAKIEENKTAITGTNGTLAQLDTTVKAEFKKANAAIDSNKTAIANDVKALTEYKTSVAAEFNGVKAGISANQTAIADDTKALADYKTTVKAELDKANAAINTNKTAIADDKKALADYKTTVTAEMNGVKSSVSQNSQAIATTDGKVNALHSIKLESGGKVSGIIMANDGATSTFDVIADKFRISSKAGDQAVFQVNSTTGETVIRTALIKDLTATNIRAGSITGNSIASNTKIVAGSANASVVMDGADANWRLYAGNASGAHAPFRVNKDGALFATNANITGHVVANSGTFRGDVYANNGVFNGTVNASAGTFNGTVNANAGTFNNVTIAENCNVLGTLYADRIVGLPAGRNFSIPEVNISPQPGVSWRNVWQTNLVSADGRFNIDCMLGGVPELKMIGDSTIQFRILINGTVVHTTRTLTASNTYRPIGELVGLPFRVGANGGNLMIQANVPEYARGGFYFRLNTGYIYSAIANPAFWK